VPWHIETDHPDCSGYAVVKDGTTKVVGCHSSRRDARAQLAALNAATDDEYRALPTNYRPALSPDVPEGRACGNCRHYDESRIQKNFDGALLAYCTLWDEFVDGAYYCNRWAPAGQDRADAPAPAKDQISGSAKNPEGSAAGKTGGIELSEATDLALRRKAADHNEAMSEAGRPMWTRVTTGALRSVYRRGSGAYSTSHRPGVSRGAWAMARVNAFLYLARTGRPQNPAYVGDNDLLDADHPKAPKERSQARQESYAPTDAMIEEARRGLDWRAEFGRGGTEVGVARARDLVNRRRLSFSTVVRMASFFARHEIDKRGRGFRPNEDGYPSPGRIAWALWGGDPGRTWANAIIKSADRRTVVNLRYLGLDSPIDDTSTTPGAPPEDGTPSAG
jgi:hypothetical protein